MVILLTAWEGVEDAEEYCAPPHNTNISYDVWKLGDIKLLITSHLDGTVKRRQQVHNSIMYILYILSVYSPFSDRVGLPPHNARGVNDEYWSSVFLRLDALPDVNHMRVSLFYILLNTQNDN